MSGESEKVMRVNLSQQIDDPVEQAFCVDVAVIVTEKFNKETRVARYLTEDVQ
jgi:hypothetical protein